MTGGATSEPPDDGAADQIRSVARRTSSSLPVSSGPVSSRRLFSGAVWRPMLSSSGAVLVVVSIVPPFSGWLRRYEWTEALQFAVLAMVGPALVALGAPWRKIGLGPWATRLADMRRRLARGGHDVASASSLRLRQDFQPRHCPWWPEAIRPPPR